MKTAHCDVKKAHWAIFQPNRHLFKKIAQCVMIRAHWAVFPYGHMGWLRLVGSLKLQVSFAEYRLFYRALLQKRPIFKIALCVQCVMIRAHWAVFPYQRYGHMGWLRLVGSLKLQVSFAEYRLFYRALLQKRPIFLRSLLIVAIPYDFTVALYRVCSTGLR